MLFFRRNKKHTVNSVFEFLWFFVSAVQRIAYRALLLLVHVLHYRLVLAYQEFTYLFWDEVVVWYFCAVWWISIRCYRPTGGCGAHCY